MAAPRGAVAGASMYDRILVMATSSAPAPAAAASRPTPGNTLNGNPNNGTQRFVPPRPAPAGAARADDEDEEEDPNPPNPPVFTFPQPGQQRRLQSARQVFQPVRTATDRDQPVDRRSRRRSRSTRSPRANAGVPTTPFGTIGRAGARDDPGSRPAQPGQPAAAARRQTARRLVSCSTAIGTSRPPIRSATTYNRGRADRTRDSPARFASMADIERYTPDDRRGVEQLYRRTFGTEAADRVRLRWDWARRNPASAASSRRTGSCAKARRSSPPCPLMPVRVVRARAPKRRARGARIRWSSPSGSGRASAARCCARGIAAPASRSAPRCRTPRGTGSTRCAGRRPSRCPAW